MLIEFIPQANNNNNSMERHKRKQKRHEILDCIYVGVLIDWLQYFVCFIVVAIFIILLNTLTLAAIKKTKTPQ